MKRGDVTGQVAMPWHDFVLSTHSNGPQRFK